MIETPSTDPYRLFMTALERALTGDTAGALRDLDRIAVEHGDQAVARIPGALAHVAVHALGSLHPVPRGGMWAIGSLVPDIEACDPARLFAARYVVAHANRDTDAATALLRAEIRHPDDDRFPAAIVATLALTVALVKLMPNEADR